MIKSNSVSPYPLLLVWAFIGLCLGFSKTYAEPPTDEPDRGLAGRVLFSIGTNMAENAEGSGKRKLRKGGYVFEGEKVITGEKSRLQLIMVDGARISVRPNSTFVIEEYKYKRDEKQEQQAVSVAQSTDKMAVSIIKGGFRTITGAIGKGGANEDGENEQYKVRTPVATIGIRGTDYNVVYCAADCAAFGMDQSTGLFVGVASGGVALKNDAGVVNVNRNQFAHVSKIDAPPVRLLQPPAGILEAEVDVSGEESTDDSEEPGDQAQAQDGDNSNGDDSENANEEPENESPSAKEESVESDAGDANEANAKPSQSSDSQAKGNEDDQAGPAAEQANNAANAEGSSETDTVSETKPQKPRRPVAGKRRGRSSSQVSRAENSDGKDADAPAAITASTGGAAEAGTIGESADGAPSVVSGADSGPSTASTPSATAASAPVAESTTNSDTSTTGFGSLGDAGGDSGYVPPHPPPPTIVEAPISQPNQQLCVETNAAGECQYVEDLAGNVDIIADSGIIESLSEEQQGDFQNILQDGDVNQVANTIESLGDAGTISGEDPGAILDVIEDSAESAGPVVPIEIFEMSFATGGISKLKALGLQNAPAATEPLTQFRANTAGQLRDFALANGVVESLGYSLFAKLQWGRWSTGYTVTPLPAGPGPFLHWVRTTQSENPQLPTTGTTNYVLIGNTQPTNLAGIEGVLGSAQLQVDFTNSTITNTLHIGIGGKNWFAAGNGGLGPNSKPRHIFEGNYQTVNVDGVAGGTGQFTGFFSGQTGVNGPSGAGLSYTLQKDGAQVNGAAAFSRAP